MKKTLLLMAISLFVLSTAAWAQQDSIIGNWKLNLAKTKYDGGAPPKERIQKFESDGADGIKFTADVVNANDSKGHNESAFKLDGKIYPFKGVANRDGISVRRIDPLTYKVLYTNKGEPDQINYYLVSKDGKTLTTHSVGLTGENQVYHRLMVYDKQ